MQIVVPTTDTTKRLNAIHIPAWLTLLSLLMLALIVRLPNIRINGVPGDTYLSNLWGFASQQDNFALYARNDINHPPIFPVLNGLVLTAFETPLLRSLVEQFAINEVVRLKIFPILAELLLITTAYIWLRDRGRLRFILPLMLAIHPGLIINSALWGQSEPLIGLFLVLALILFNRAKPSIAWICFGLALLTKFQSIALLPLMVILTFRRYPLKIALRSHFIGILTWAIGLFPYIVVGGTEKALHPYSVGSVGVFPFTTMFAFNFWHVIEPRFWSNSLRGVGPQDHLVSYFAPLTDLQMGFLMLTLYTALICVVMWRQALQPREFVWGAALYFGFFMLPTQIHQRYLYPAVVMTIFALAQDRRLWWVAVGMAWTFTMNMIWALNSPFYGLGSVLWYYFGIGKVRFALLNVILFVEQTLITGFPNARRVLLPTRLLTVGIVASLIALAFFPPLASSDDSFVPFDGFTVENVARCVGYEIEWRNGQMWLTLYFDVERPMTTFMIGKVEVVRDGRIVGMVTSADNNPFRGSWRWEQGRLNQLTFVISIDEPTLPDDIFVSFTDFVTHTPILMQIDGQTQSVYHISLTSRNR